jgi:tRNA-Thr(GGU) m(6)t(6)A37 methyltransferase TsaA
MGDQIRFNPIGFVRSNYSRLEDIPRQSIFSPDEKAEIIVKEDYVQGLIGLSDYEYLIVLFYFHLSEKPQLIVKPKGRDGVEQCGVFASRSPHRPNPIGLSIVKLITVRENVIEFKGVDMIDGTPVLDIKGYSKDLNPE